MPTELHAFSIPFRDLGPVLDDWRELACVHKPSHGVPPHVTLLAPAPPDIDAAADALGSFAPLDVTFSVFGRFPGALWLAPEPAEPFVAMTEALMRAFPGSLPYDGQFEGITPHLTVAQGDRLYEAETALVPRLPVRSRAGSVVLFRQVAPDRWDEAAELHL